MKRPSEALSRDELIELVKCQNNTLCDAARQIERTGAGLPREEDRHACRAAASALYNQAAGVRR